MPRSVLMKCWRWEKKIKYKLKLTSPAKSHFWCVASEICRRTMSSQVKPVPDTNTHKENGPFAHIPQCVLTRGQYPRPATWLPSILQVSWRFKRLRDWPSIKMQPSWVEYRQKNQLHFDFSWITPGESLQSKNKRGGETALMWVCNHTWRKNFLWLFLSLATSLVQQTIPSCMCCLKRWLTLSCWG